MNFVANQSIGLFGAHFYSALTSSLTSWLDSSRSLLLDAHFATDQIARRFGSIVSYAEGSPAKLGTPRRSDSSCKSCQLSWGILSIRILHARVVS
jgi:hypothetical protein